MKTDVKEILIQHQELLDQQVEWNTSFAQRRLELIKVSGRNPDEN